MSTLSLIANSVTKVLRQVVTYRSYSAISAAEPGRVIEYRSITKERVNPTPVETSIKYLKSNAYQITYGEEPVWVKYRRNHKGALPPRKTRRTCIRKGVISTGNPCPICRDEYLVLDEKNIDLLKQFISPNTGAILGYSVTGLCQKQHQNLLINVHRARDRGLLTFDVPYRHYNYSDYIK